MVLSENRDLDAYDEFFKRLKERFRGPIHEVFELEREKPAKERKLVTFVSDKWGWRLAGAEQNRLADLIAVCVQ